MRFQIENPTPSIDTYLLEEYVPAKFHPDQIWNDGALSFWKRLPQHEQEEEQDE